LPTRAALAASVLAGLGWAAGLPLTGVTTLTGAALGLLALTDAARASVEALAAASLP
jgi:hypothetical protein